jgi:hypothetical protein
MATLANIRDRCKQESDNVNASFVSDAEWLNYINASYQEAYGLYAEAFGARYFAKNPPQSISTDGTNQLFALASDFWKLLLCEVQVQTGQAQYVNLKPFLLAEKNSIGYFNQSIPAAGQTVRVWYIPTVTPLANDVDVLSTALTANGGEEYVVADACIKALAKEESDVSVFLARKNALKLRLEQEASNRDASNPSRILDVMGRRARSMQYALVGTNIMFVGGATPGWYYGQGDWGAHDYDSDGGFY